MISESAQRKMAACKALFDSPNAGEAAAARAAYSRLVAKHGQPEPEGEFVETLHYYRNRDGGGQWSVYEFRSHSVAAFNAAFGRDARRRRELEDLALDLSTLGYVLKHANSGLEVWSDDCLIAGELGLQQVREFVASATSAAFEYEADAWA